MATSGAICPHCSASNAVPGKFCTACGRALPSPVKVAPRVISGKSKDFAESGAGQAMQSEELGKQARASVKILLVLGILAGLLGMVLVLVGIGNGPIESDDGMVLDLKIVGITMLVLSGIYLALSFWARTSPLAASITGLVMYVSLQVADLVAAPEMVLRGIIIKIIIIGALAKAVSAGVKHRELLKRMGKGAGAGQG